MLVLRATVFRVAGATIAAAPVLVANLMAPDYHQSLAALLVGFALSEMWRAPAAIMIRDVSPPNLGSTGSAVHLCVRNLIGGLGPLGTSLPPTWASPNQDSLSSLLIHNLPLFRYQSDSSLYDAL